MPINYQPFQQGYDYMNQAAQNAMPSPESLDRAGARLRARTDTNRRAADEETADRYAGSGRMNSGGYEAARRGNMIGAQNAYATGYSQLEDDYEKNRMEGAKNLGQIGSNYSGAANDMGTLNLAEDQFGLDEELGRRKLDIDETEIGYKHDEAVNQNLIDFFTSMGQYGNATSGLPSTSPFYNEFGRLKQSLFQFLGLA